MTIYLSYRNFLIFLILEFNNFINYYSQGKNFDLNYFMNIHPAFINTFTSFFRYWIHFVWILINFLNGLVYLYHFAYNFISRFGIFFVFYSVFWFFIYHFNDLINIEFIIINNQLIFTNFNVFSNFLFRVYH
jgi:hypothetical protein